MSENEPVINRNTAPSVLPSSRRRFLPLPLVAIILAGFLAVFLAGSVLYFLPAPEANGFLKQRLRAEKATPDALRDLSGTWVYQSTALSMGLKFAPMKRVVDEGSGQDLVAGVFEWVAARGDMPKARFYARGSYRIDGDVLILQQRDDMGAPIDRQKPWMAYLPMAMEKINVRMDWVASADKNGSAIKPLQMQWVLPKSERDLMMREFFLVWPDQDVGPLYWSKVSTAYR